MIKINVIGSILGTTGYDSHTRSLANALYKITDCRLSTSLPQGWEALVNDAELDMITKQRNKDDYNLIVSTPQTWKLYTQPGKNIGYCVWEGDKVPVGWIDEFLNSNIDMIFVPSEHTKLAIINTCANWSVIHSDTDEHLKILEKIKVIPHGVNREVFYSQRKKVEDEVSNVTQLETQNKTGEVNKTENIPALVDNHVDTFQFICNKGWRGTNWDRGGVQYVIKAFAEEFKKDENVKLIIKLNPAYINPQTLRMAIDKLKLPEDRPKIQVILENMDFKKLCTLYNQGDCFICATRAESFNLPGLEAMSCGLPTIQTNYGGQTDYMTDKNSLLIGFDLVNSEEFPSYEGIQWAVPNYDEIKEQMRWAFENQDKIKEMGIQAEKDSAEWTWDKTAEKIKKEIEQIK